MLLASMWISAAARCLWAERENGLTAAMRRVLRAFSSIVKGKLRRLTRVVDT